MGKTILLSIVILLGLSTYCSAQKEGNTIANPQLLENVTDIHYFPAAPYQSEGAGYNGSELNPGSVVTFSPKGRQMIFVIGGDEGMPCVENVRLIGLGSHENRPKLILQKYKNTFYRAINPGYTKDVIIENFTVEDQLTKGAAIAFNPVKINENSAHIPENITIASNTTATLSYKNPDFHPVKNDGNYQIQNGGLNAESAVVGASEAVIYTDATYPLILPGENEIILTGETANRLKILREIKLVCANNGLNQNSLAVSKYTIKPGDLINEIY